MNWRSKSESIKAAFDRDGYLCIRGFVEPDELLRLESNIQRLITERLPSLPREHVFFEDKNDPATLKQIQQLAIHDPSLDRCMNQGQFPDLARLLLAGPAVSINMQYFNKPPLVGRATPPHQDGHYFMLQPCEAITMWLALDPADTANGCVRYIPGSHLKSLRPHGRTQTLGFSQAITNYQQRDRDAEVALAAMPGDLLVHHAMTIHRADANQSETRQRRSLGLIYYSERAKIDDKAHRAYQDQLKQEMFDAGKI